MPKVLDGAQLASFIKVRQAKQVRRLKQADSITPRLAIIMNDQPNTVIETYVRLKQAYGDDIGVDVLVERCDDDQMIAAIDRYNADETIHGIVVQLPIGDQHNVEEILDRLAPQKDVDGLGKDAAYVSATAEAIDWLLAGYSVELEGKRIVIVGRGRLVGGPLEQLWRTQGYAPLVLDKASADVTAQCMAADIIVSATGQAGLITNAHVKPGATVVDAGTVSEDGKIVGDIASELRRRSDISLTPEKGGVGPLTVAMMFDHVVRAANRIADMQAHD